ncbi:hypothetical protein [Engelhardtia mirabilis]|uniref:Spermidine synthase n=1 Tax=Engelhardtia mirabilis TaxID=2528011 RepID=A0A518BR12_9BACT|nr:Spermidine synthase [Planctomycetes bacterium Pla133]QDV03712.1 Spermidine synthase [Planctomycetes bacterium Pla86]
MPAQPIPVPTSRLVALFLVSCGLLLVQVALTKIFSIVLWYHFGFLVISLAMLGFATSGVWLSRRPELLEQGSSLLARLSSSAALVMCLSLWLVTHTQVNVSSLIQDHNEGALLAVIAAVGLPFFFLGGAVSATLTVHRASAGKVYSANLLGSGLGCALAVVLFDGLHLSATDVVLSSALLVAIGAVGFSLTAPMRARIVPVLVTVGLVALFAVQGRHDWLRLVAPDDKPLARVEQWEEDHNLRKATLLSGEEVFFSEYTLDPVAMAFDVVTPYGEKRRVTAAEVGWNPGEEIPLENASLVEFTKWTSLSRVDAFTWPFRRDPWGLWGLSSQYKGDYPRQKGITIDSWAMTNVMEWDRAAGDGRPPEILEYLPAGLVHRIKPAAEILCIGAGGGMDLLTALRFGASKVVGVEINPSVVESVRTCFLEFQGGMYDPENPTAGVEINIAEGRHYLERDERLYDVVQLSGVDTASTTQAGAFSLSENFLYTAEAFATYLERTRDDGFVTLTRWVLPDEDGFPRNTLRLFTMAWGALADAGIADPGQHIYLVQSQGFSVIIFGKTPFTDAQLATLDAESERLDFGALYHPRHPSEYVNPYTKGVVTNWYDEFAAAPDKQAFFDDYRYDVVPPTDDRPFFFETSRFEQLLEKSSFFNPLGGVTAHGILVVLFGLVLLAGWFFVLMPLRRLGGISEEAVAGVRRLPLMLYFASLGLGFILVEVVLSQEFILFLGNPLYSLAVVLFSVLVFSGIGAALSSRVKHPELALIAVIALAAVYPLILDDVFDRALMLPTPGRIAVSVALLAPLSVAMGMPFPLGLGRIARGDARLTAWAWGINGYMSVVGSVLTIGLGIAFGFQMVVWIGAGVYGVALLSAPLLAARHGGGDGEVEPEPEAVVDRSLLAESAEPSAS